LRLLLVEDDEDIAETLIAFLQRQGFVVDLAPALEIAQTAIEEGEFDLILLDRLLPDGDGLELIAHAKAIGRPQRFLLLTALDGVDDRIKGLGLGADDYVVKPFEPRELVARIRNALRRTVSVVRETRRFGPIVYDVGAGTFSIDEVPFALRRIEALLLEALMVRPGAIVRRETLESRVYGYDQYVSANSLESQISRLRKTLNERTGKVGIQVVRGLGYRLIQD
jgi:two-component system OmpR family response regulator